MSFTGKTRGLKSPPPEPSQRRQWRAPSTDIPEIHIPPEQNSIVAPGASTMPSTVPFGSTGRRCSNPSHPFYTGTFCPACEREGNGQDSVPQILCGHPQRRGLECSVCDKSSAARHQPVQCDHPEEGDWACPICNKLSPDRSMRDVKDIPSDRPVCDHPERVGWFCPVCDHVRLRENTDHFKPNPYLSESKVNNSNIGNTTAWESDIAGHDTTLWSETTFQRLHPEQSDSFLSSKYLDRSQF